MKFDTEFLQMLKKDTSKWINVEEYFSELQIPARHIILKEGETAHYIYLIKKGAVRMWLNNNGIEVTFQFFFENSAVASIDSFLSGKPSLFYIESMEPTSLAVLSKEGFEEIFILYPELKDTFQRLLFERFSNYAKLFLSRIKDKPLTRYKELLNSNPEIIQRVPQHYIASYLGITPVSLSRLRKKI